MAARDDLKKFTKALNKTIKEMEGPVFLKPAGKLAVSTIFKRTKKGQVVPKDGGAKKRIVKLAPATIAARRRKSLASDTSPRKSNLTETGIMLNSLRARFTKMKAVVSTTGSRNIKLAEIHQEGTDTIPARPFLNFSSGEIITMTKLFEKIFNRQLKKNFKAIGGI